MKRRDVERFLDHIEREEDKSGRDSTKLMIIMKNGHIYRTPYGVWDRNPQINFTVRNGREVRVLTKDVLMLREWI